jgi:Domain of unknown function (DUF6089)
VNRIILSLLVASVFSIGAKAQMNWETVHTGEFGFTLGGAHYFGDLNTRASFNRPKPAVGVFFRKQFGNYVSARLTGHFAQLGYSDIYSKNEYQRLRNLSFNTNIYEVALQGDFNFFKFIPEDPAHSFTPYVTLGVGVMNFDPYAYLNGEKVFLRQLGTEGQTKGYLGRTPYSTTAIVIPFGVGLKYNLTERVNISFEITHRFTNTDYLDDVSTTYAGLNTFDYGPSDINGNPTLSQAQLLQDRGYEISGKQNTFTQGQQRGFSKQKDQYIIGEIGISFNLSSYRCPTAY